MVFMVTHKIMAFLIRGSTTKTASCITFAPSILADSRQSAGRERMADIYTKMKKVPPFHSSKIITAILALNLPFSQFMGCMPKN